MKLSEPHKLKKQMDLRNQQTMFEYGVCVTQEITAHRITTFNYLKTSKV